MRDEAQPSPGTVRRKGREVIRRPARKTRDVEDLAGGWRPGGSATAETSRGDGQTLVRPELRRVKRSEAQPSPGTARRKWDRGKSRETSRKPAAQPDQLVEVEDLVQEEGDQGALFGLIKRAGALRSQCAGVVRRPERTAGLQP